MPKTISVAVPEACTLCPRQCKADRAAGQTGFCGAGRTLKAARAALHFWEEPCISGTRGSGTVFFSGCTLKCCFCQNYPISAEGLGREITVERLAEIFLDLQAQGAHNINLVTPGQWRPWIIAALDLARAQGLHLPIVCNTGGYETVESVHAWRGFIDIWLADLKYVFSSLSGTSLISLLRTAAAAGFIRSSILTNHCFFIIGSITVLQRSCVPTLCV